MTRVAHLEPYLSAAQLKHNYREATHPSEARRWQLLWLMALSWTIKEAAAVVGINYDYAREIVKATISKERQQFISKSSPQKNVPAMPYSIVCN